jgi:hypothetical protein
MSGCRLQDIARVLLAVMALATLCSKALAAQWVYINTIPGGDACAARLAGKEVDTMLMLNRNGDLILVAGRSDWHSSGSYEIGLRVDDFATDTLQANAFNNLMLVLIKDETILGRLKTAKDLYWSLPSGKYHAIVVGLGDALDWVHTCEQGKHRGV